MFKTEEALAIIGGHVDEELLLRNEYLAIENEILRKKISGRITLREDDTNQWEIGESWRIDEQF